MVRSGSLGGESQMKKNGGMPVVAIIMDGNGRWAQERGRTASFGHKAGADTFRSIIESAKKMGIKSLIAFAFSEHNWKRPKHEVSFLMSLAVRYFQEFGNEAYENDIRVRIVGDHADARIPKMVVDAIDAIEGKTMMCSSMDLFIAFNYSGELDLLHAAHSIASHVERDELKASDINLDVFRGHLLSKDVPDVDLLIRTSGEERLSDTLPLQVRHAEFVTVSEFWPDFSEEVFRRVLEEYQGRNRRFGGRAELVAAE